MELTATVKLRRMVLEHLSRYTWNAELPDRVYDILQEVREDTPRLRCCVYKEREVLKDRINMALNQELRGNIIINAEKALNEPIRRDLPLIDVLPTACDQCPIDKYYVSDACRHCLTHKCMNNCPKKAISIVNNRAFIDRDLCVECGMCHKSCPYGAILEIHRPCVRACAVGALQIGKYKTAQIDHDKCVLCGQCRIACPFGAIDERSFIIPVIESIRAGKEVIAMVAPSIVGQFGMKVKLGQIFNGLLQCGFSQVHEIGVGADLCCYHEAEDYMEHVPEKQSFMTSSCCPAFVKMLKTHVEGAEKYISSAGSPMYYSAKLMREQHPDAIIVFIGPCIAKKHEQTLFPEYMDFVLTFEEVMCMMEGKDIKVENCENIEYAAESSKVALRFPLHAGVSEAVVDTVTRMGGTVRKGMYVSGLADCKKAVEDLIAGREDASYIEGMSCLNGCIDGPSTVGDYRITKVAVTKNADIVPKHNALESDYVKDLIEK